MTSKFDELLKAIREAITAWVSACDVTRQWPGEYGTKRFQLYGFEKWLQGAVIPETYNAAIEMAAATPTLPGYQQREAIAHEVATDDILAALQFICRPGDATVPVVERVYMLVQAAHYIAAGIRGFWEAGDWPDTFPCLLNEPGSGPQKHHLEYMKIAIADCRQLEAECMAELAGE